MKHHICLSGTPRHFPSQYCAVCRGEGQDVDGSDYGPLNWSADLADSTPRAETQAPQAKSY
jgi:hypothetical protein